MQRRDLGSNPSSSIFSFFLHSRSYSEILGKRGGRATLVPHGECSRDHFQWTRTGSFQRFSPETNMLRHRYRPAKLECRSGQHTSDQQRGMRIVLRLSGQTSNCSGTKLYSLFGWSILGSKPSSSKLRSSTFTLLLLQVYYQTTHKTYA